MTDILDVSFDDVVEPRTAEADDEVEITIVNVRNDLDKNGHPYLLPRFEVKDDPYAKEFTHFMRLPHDEMNKKELNNCKYRLLEFYKTFGIDPARPISPEDDLPGQTGWAILGVKDDDFTGGETNYVKKFIPPHR